LIHSILREKFTKTRSGAASAVTSRCAWRTAALRRTCVDYPLHYEGPANASIGLLLSKT